MRGPHFYLACALSVVGLHSAELFGNSPSLAGTKGENTDLRRSAADCSALPSITASAHTYCPGGLQGCGLEAQGTLLAGAWNCQLKMDCEHSSLPLEETIDNAWEVIGTDFRMYKPARAGSWTCKAYAPCFCQGQQHVAESIPFTVAVPLCYHEGVLISTSPAAPKVKRAGPFAAFAASTIDLFDLEAEYDEVTTSYECRRTLTTFDVQARTITESHRVFDPLGANIPAINFASNPGQETFLTSYPEAISMACGDGTGKAATRLLARKKTWNMEWIGEYENDNEEWFRSEPEVSEIIGEFTSLSLCPLLDPNSVPNLPEAIANGSVVTNL